MKHSLRLRLLAGTLVWLLAAVLLTGWGLRALFKEHITEQLQAQLAMQLDALSAAVDWSAKDGLTVERLSDARFAQPLSGLYWQIDAWPPAPAASPVAPPVAPPAQAGAPAAALARSRSLWDQVLALPADGTAPEAGRNYRVVTLQDAQGRNLLALQRRLQLPEEAAPPLRLLVAGDQALLAEPLQRFTRLLGLALGMLSLGLALAVALQLQLALRPLTLLRQRLAAVRSGAAAQLQGNFPQELTPLVAEFNHVLAENADIVQRARTQAGNLAHAVHTPLTILANAAAQDHSALGQLVQEQVASAHRQVDYHLARARAAAAVRASGLATPVLQPVQALLRTMARLHAARGLSFTLADGAPDLAFKGEAQDLYEMLGNLLDNAGKHARTQVQVNVRRATDAGRAQQLCITVDDDGPGIPEEARARMFERGVQLDERRPGSGLGLDIVRALCESYGASIQAQSSPLGGARMCLCLPLA